MLKTNKEVLYAKKTDFYLLKQKSISEGDLFVTDYIKTKQRVVKIEQQLELLQLQLESLKPKNKVIKLYEEE
mgnify:CR=1 FL=1